MKVTLNKWFNVILLLIIALLPLIIFINTDFISDAIESVLIGLVFALASFLITIKGKNVQSNSLNGSFIGNLNYVLPFICKSNFRFIIKLGKKVLIMDNKNGAFIWLTQESELTSRYKIKSTLFALVNFTNQLKESESRINLSLP